MASVLTHRNVNCPTTLHRTNVRHNQTSQTSQETHKNSSGYEPDEVDLDALQL